MKRSISLIGQPAFLTAGSAGLLGGSKAQCVDHVAPCSTQRRSTATWSAVSCLPLFLGGMCSSGSSLSIRTISSLSSGLPGTIARPPLSSLANAPSFVSSRRPALRVLSSGPWQAKQLSERIGRTSRAKLTGRGLASPAEFAASPSAWTEALLATIESTKPIRRQDVMPSPICRRRPVRPSAHRRPQTIRPPLQSRANSCT